MDSTERFLMSYVASGQSEVCLAFMDDIEGIQLLNHYMEESALEEAKASAQFSDLRFVG